MEQDEVSKQYMNTLSLIIFSILMLATVFVRLKLNSNISSELSLNYTRIRTWWYISFVCITSLYIGGWTLTLLLHVLIIWMTVEFVQLKNNSRQAILIPLIGMASISYNFTILYFQEISDQFYLIPFLLVTFSFIFKNKDKLHSTIIVFLIITSISSLIILSQNNIYGADNNSLILFLLFVTSINDIAQYLCGTYLGKHKLLPKISPKKTIEGAIGGIVLTSLVTYLYLPFIIKVSWHNALLVGFITSILGICGDLFFSNIKRRADRKDFSTSVPGHGGILDRLDSLILTAPGFGLCINIII